MEAREILHADMNSYYASVEMMQNPWLKGKAVAVCGSTEDRHGIVLAKSELAKKAGVKTGMVNWEARQRCPGLIVVPPHYDEYIKYSKLFHEICYRHTDLVEPFGMDEVWMDITNSLYRAADSTQRQPKGRLASSGADKGKNRRGAKRDVSERGLYHHHDQRSGKPAL